MRNSTCTSSIIYTVLLICVHVTAGFYSGVVIQTHNGLRHVLHLQKRELSVKFGPVSTYNAQNGHVCVVCPPGTHKHEDCTINGTLAMCKPCPAGQYSETYNIAHTCAICSTYCMDRNGIEEHACNSTANMKCRCTDGHYNHSKGGGEWICLPYSKCLPGYEVRTPGNSEYDTVCKECEKGAFSPENSLTAKCLPCSGCHDNQVVKEPCNSRKDITCISKDKKLIEHVVIPIVVVIVGVFVLVFIIVCLWRKGILKPLCTIDGESLDECTERNAKESMGNAVNATYMVAKEIIEVNVHRDKDDHGPPVEITNKETHQTMCDFFRFISAQLALRNEKDESVWIEFLRILFGNTNLDVIGKTNKIDQIRYDFRHDGVREQIYRCLLACRQMMDDDPLCVNHIISALNKTNQNNLAIEIKQKFVEIIESNSSLSIVGDNRMFRAQ